MYRSPKTRKEREKGIENMRKPWLNFQNLKEETDIQIHKHRVQIKMNPKKPTPIHIVKMTKVKDREFYRQQERNKKSYTRGPL